MECNGKVIIFENEDDAKLWFNLISEFNQRSKIESLEFEMRSKLDYYENAEKKYNEYKKLLNEK